MTDEHATCNHCGQAFELGQMVEHDDCSLCVPCDKAWRDYAERCDHQWDEHVDKDSHDVLRCDFCGMIAEEEKNGA